LKNRNRLRSCAFLASFLILLLVVFQIASADELEQICAQASPNQVIKKIPIPEKPSYFMRAFRDQNVVSLGSSTGNILVDLDTGAIHKAPGIYDSVPFTSGGTVSIPRTEYYDGKEKVRRTIDRNAAILKNIKYSASHGVVYEKSPSAEGKTITKKTNLSENDLKRTNESYSTDPLIFYDTKDILANKANPREIGSDPDMPGDYQSTGTLVRGTSGDGIQRVAMDNGTLLLRDYAVSANGGSTTSVTPQGAAIELCPDQSLQLPMINKSGTEIAGYDYQTLKTTIYSINDKTGRCTPVETLPFKTGKVDFGWYGNKIAFHADSSDPSGHGFKAPSKTQSLNAFIYDRKSKQIYEMDKPDNTNSYYPVFLKNGDLAYVSEDKNKATDNFSVVVVRSNYAYDSRREICATCSENPAKKSALALFGAFVLKKCSSSSGQVTEESAMNKTLNLPEKACRSLVADAWNTREESKKNIVSRQLVGENKNAHFETLDVSSLAPYKNLTEAAFRDACEWRTTNNTSDASPNPKVIR
jgi:hypothetical protein